MYSSTPRWARRCELSSPIESGASGRAAGNSPEGGEGVAPQVSARGLEGGHLNAVGDVDCGFGAAFLGRDRQSGWRVKGIVP